MWNFFKNKQTLLWAWGGVSLIVALVVASVQIDVKINEWFGEFYNRLQEALGNPNTVTLAEFNSLLVDFAILAGVWMLIQVVLAFFTSHWVMRWRTSMANQYHIDWHGGIEGASQRVQEDTLKFARIVEDLGVGLLEAVLVLFAFLPILWGLSTHMVDVPVIGPIAGNLVWVALLTAIGGTALLSVVGIKLPGIEYDIQKNEAAYRKHLVVGEDAPMDKSIARSLYDTVLSIHYKSFLHYLYFNATKFSFLQGMVIVPYVVMAPTIITGAVTLGVVTQIGRAFNKVAESLQYLLRSWHKIVELMSVYKRLREYEALCNNGCKN